jgi:hypothetical protein
MEKNSKKKPNKSNPTANQSLL